MLAEKAATGQKLDEGTSNLAPCALDQIESSGKQEPQSKHPPAREHGGNRSEQQREQKGGVRVLKKDAPSNLAVLAQSGEHSTVTAEVRGSKPLYRAKFGLKVFMDAHSTVTAEEGDRYPLGPPNYALVAQW